MTATGPLSSRIWNPAAGRGGARVHASDGASQPSPLTLETSHGLRGSCHRQGGETSKRPALPPANWTPTRGNTSAASHLHAFAQAVCSSREPSPSTQIMPFWTQLQLLLPEIHLFASTWPGSAPVLCFSRLCCNDLLHECPPHGCYELQGSGVESYSPSHPYGCRDLG